MLLPNHKIEKAVSEDPTRFSIGYVHLNAEKRQLEASNGKILAVVPIEAEEGETLAEDFFPPKTVALARKAGGRHLEKRIWTNAAGQHQLADCSALPKPELTSTQFPNVDSVTPEPGNRPPDLVINAELLHILQQAISSGRLKDKDEPAGIALWFDRKRGKPDFEGAIYAQACDGDGAYGVIMPMARAAADKLRPHNAPKDAPVPEAKPEAEVA